MALYGLVCADVRLRNYSLTHSTRSFRGQTRRAAATSSAWPAVAILAAQLTRRRERRRRDPAVQTSSRRPPSSHADADAARRRSPALRPMTVLDTTELPLPAVSWQISFPRREMW